MVMEEQQRHTRHRRQIEAPHTADGQEVPNRKGEYDVVQPQRTRSMRATRG